MCIDGDNSAMRDSPPIDAPSPDDPARYERFLDLFMPERDRLYAFIYSLVPNHADAEDIFQRCSVIVWRKMNEFEVGTSFFAWACTVAQFEVRNFIRSSIRDRHCFDVELVSQLAQERVAQLPAATPRLDALQTCIQAMSETDRQLLITATLGEQKLPDIAKDRGRALQSIYNRLAILRRKLAECIQRHSRE